MHYKDGTPATLGDIVKHDSGDVGIVIGGQIGNDYCSTQVVKFVGVKPAGGYPQPQGAGFIGQLRDENQQFVATASVVVQHDLCVQTRECLKIGHVDIGHG